MLNPDTQTRLQTISAESLARENLHYTGTGGVSANNREQGFVPAFLDTQTGAVYRSRFANGMPAPIHVLVGLPERLVERHGATNTPLHIKCSVISGFLREGSFYSREAAMQATASGNLH